MDLVHPVPQAPTGNSAAADIDLRVALAEAESALRAVGEAECAGRLAKRGAELGSPELRVVVFGEFSRGKSTLINALLGRRVLEAKAMPTTGHVTRIVHGEREEVRAAMRGGDVKTCALTDLGSFTTLDLDRTAREDVEAIEVAVNCPLLRDGMTLIDTPGVCDPGAQTARALAAIASADLVLLVLNASQPLTEKEHELAVDWMVRGLDKAVVPVVNWMNVVEERDRPELRLRLDRWCREHLSSPLGLPWFEVNALAALRHVLESGPPPTDSFADLKAALDGLKGPKRQQIQNQSRLGQLRAELADARRANGETSETLRRDIHRAERVRDEARRELRGRVDRLAAKARLARQGLMTHAAHALAARLERLTGYWFKGETKERLEQHANEWFTKMLMEAAHEVQKRADGELLNLTTAGVRRPEPLTIRERLVLKSRLTVGEVEWTPASSETITRGTVAGGVVGTFLVPVPVIGTIIGAGIGGYLANWIYGSPPDYVAAYAEHARRNWATHAANLQQVLAAQFDARTETLSRHLAGQLERAELAATDSAGLANEARRREEAEEALVRCERAIDSWADRF